LVAETANSVDEFLNIDQQMFDRLDSRSVGWNGKVFYGWVREESWFDSNDLSASPNGVFDEGECVQNLTCKGGECGVGAEERGVVGFSRIWDRSFANVFNPEQSLPFSALFCGYNFGSAPVPGCQYTTSPTNTDYIYEPGVSVNRGTLLFFLAQTYVRKFIGNSVYTLCTDAISNCDSTGYVDPCKGDPTVKRVKVRPRKNTAEFTSPFCDCANNLPSCHRTKPSTYYASPSSTPPIPPNNIFSIFSLTSNESFDDKYTDEGCESAVDGEAIWQLNKVFGECRVGESSDVVYGCRQAIITRTEADEDDNCLPPLTDFEFDVRVCNPDIDPTCDVDLDKDACFEVALNDVCLGSSNELSSVEISPSFFTRQDWESAGFTCRSLLWDSLPNSVCPFFCEGAECGEVAPGCLESAGYSAYYVNNVWTCASNNPQKVQNASNGGVQAFNTQCLKKGPPNSVSVQGRCVSPPSSAPTCTTATYPDSSPPPENCILSNGGPVFQARNLADCIDMSVCSYEQIVNYFPGNFNGCVLNGSSWTCSVNSPATESGGDGTTILSMNPFFVDMAKLEVEGYNEIDPSTWLMAVQALKCMQEFMEGTFGESDLSGLPNHLADPSTGTCQPIGQPVAPCDPSAADDEPNTCKPAPTSLGCGSCLKIGLLQTVLEEEQSKYQNELRPVKVSGAQEFVPNTDPTNFNRAYEAGQAPEPLRTALSKEYCAGSDGITRAGPEDIALVTGIYGSEEEKSLFCCDGECQSSIKEVCSLTGSNSPCVYPTLLKNFGRRTMQVIDSFSKLDRGDLEELHRVHASKLGLLVGS